MRHDVDKLPGNALKMARLEHEMGVKATYYFRAVPVSWDEGIIREIAGMGHEVGYHYENLESVTREGKRRMKSGVRESARIDANEEINISLADRQGNKFIARSGKDDWRERLIDLGYEDFCWNLERLREIVPVRTVCMHGSPLSKYDNRMIWEKYDYKELGIIGEPYFDVDYKEVFYITDTGRKWNNEAASVRDRVGYENLGIQELRDLGIEELTRCHSTQEIIAAVEAGKFTDKVMINVHPQRWLSALHGVKISLAECEECDEENYYKI